MGPCSRQPACRATNCCFSQQQRMRHGKHSNSVLPQDVQCLLPVNHATLLDEVQKDLRDQNLVGRSKLLEELCLKDSGAGTPPGTKAMQRAVKLLDTSLQSHIDNCRKKLPGSLSKACASNTTIQLGKKGNSHVHQLVRKISSQADVHSHPQWVRSGLGPFPNSTLHTTP